MSEVVENATFDERMYEKYELHYLPGRDRPAHVFDLVYGRRVTDPAEIGWLVATAWSDAHIPAASMSIAVWIELFQMGGYTEDGHPAQRPTRPLTLYRCADPRRVHRLAWTASLEIAQRFAVINSTRYGQIPRHIYTVTVEPERVLAHITTRKEDEYVTDTRGLRATRIEVTS